MVEREGKLYFVGNRPSGTGNWELSVAQWEAAGPTLITDPQTRQDVINRAPWKVTQGQAPNGLGPMDLGCFLTNSGKTVPVSGIGDFFVTLGLGSIEGVSEQIGYDQTVLYPLPQSSQEEFLRARPDHAQSATGAVIGETIGPCQIYDNRFWFGKTFHEGKGTDGVGGIGYFDTEERKYTLFSPPEIVDWSVSSLLAENYAVWFGLVRHSDGADVPGGLLQFDPVTGETKKYALNEVILTIRRWQDSLFLGTSNGLYVLQYNQLRHYVMELEPDGKTFAYREENLPPSP